MDLTMAMQVRKPSQYPRQQMPHLVRRLRLPHPPRPIPTLDEFHRVIGLAGGQSTPVEDLDQILVTDLAEGVELTAQERGLGGGDQLQRQLAVADQVLDPVHAARAALTQEGTDFVAFRY